VQCDVYEIYDLSDDGHMPETQFLHLLFKTLLNTVDEGHFDKECKPVSGLWLSLKEPVAAWHTM
jgi:hypothetical protein